MNNTTFGERLLLAMNEAKVNQADLARAINVSKSAINQLISGKSKTLKPENLVKTCRHLRVRIEWLATGELPMRPELFTAADRQLIDTYHRLPPAKQATVSNVVRDLAGDYLAS